MPFQKGHNYGGAKPGAGRKPDEVRKIERAALEELRAVPGRDKTTKVHIVEGCIARLWVLAHQSEDVGAAVKACEALLNRWGGRPAQKVELTGDGQWQFILHAPQLPGGAKMLPAGK